MTIPRVLKNADTMLECLLRDDIEECILFCKHSNQSLCFLVFFCFSHNLPITIIFTRQIELFCYFHSMFWKYFPKCPQFHFPKCTYFIFHERNGEKGGKEQGNVSMHFRTNYKNMSLHDLLTQFDIMWHGNYHIKSNHFKKLN